MSSSSSSSSGIGLAGLLGVAFVVLKLTGYIDWSWWWVTAPFWGGIAICLVVIAGIGLVWCGLTVIEALIPSTPRRKRIKVGR